MGLELGSDDYISKPFSIRELMLRVKNLLNRVYAQNSNNENIDLFSNLVDLDLITVKRLGENRKKGLIFSYFLFLYIPTR